MTASRTHVLASLFDETEADECVDREARVADPDEAVCAKVSEVEAGVTALRTVPVPVHARQAGAR
jgi:hypothetical protein